MATYVLIHGAHHGGWCWYKVAMLLRKKGHVVKAPDLPGHGKDKTPIQEVTLTLCVEKVCQLLDTMPEPVILIGHSLGGVIISQVAEYIPNKIKTLVYLAAALLRNGESTKAAHEATLPLVNRSSDYSYITLKEDLVSEFFYGDCTVEDVTRAKSLLGPESVALLTTPIRVSENNFGRVPRIYIETLFDKIISPSEQKRMYTALPCQKVISMKTSHSPFFSAPELLTSHLVSIAN